MTRHEHRGSTNRSTAYQREQSRCSAVQSPVANDGCLSSRADFIPSWLNHMQNNHPPDIPRPKSPLDSNNLSWHPNGLTAVRFQLNPGTRHYQSSDIIIQDSPARSPRLDQGCHCHHDQTAPDSDNKNLHDGERHNHTTRPASATSENSLKKNYVFEKQPRRKTRRDRYDTTKSKVRRVDKGNGKKTSARVSKKGRLRSSREVMANFRSPAIANPDQKITLEQKFTPGLFVNGRSSASLADLAFNDIPLSREDVKTCEKGHPSNSGLRQRKKKNPRPEETEMFADALKRLRADYPPPESASRPTSTVVSTVTCTRRSNGDDNERPLPRDSPTPRSHTPRSLSIRNHPTAVSSGGSLTQKTQRRHIIEQDLAAVRSRGEHTPNGQDTAGFPKYQDKGVMVSPWMHQRAREDMPYDSGDHELRQTRAESSNSRADIHMPNAFSKTPIPETREEGVEGLGFKAKGIEYLTYPHDRMHPMSFVDSTSSHYPSNAVFPPFASGLAPFDRLDVSQVIDMSHRHANGIDWPAKSIAFQPHQETFREANADSRRISQIVDDIPGETLKEYINRMEREILGAGEPSVHYIDKAPRPSEANVLDNRKQPNKLLREIECTDRFPSQYPLHEVGNMFPRHYPRLSYPEEDPNESEPAFVWQPNHMIWR